MGKSQQRKALNKKLPPDPEIMHSFMAPGSLPIKDFCNLMTRYGIKGYHLNRYLNGIFVDIVFPHIQKCIRIGEDFSQDEYASLGHQQYDSISIEPSLSEEWFECIAWIKGINRTHLKPINTWMFGRVKYMEASQK